MNSDGQEKAIPEDCGTTEGQGSRFHCHPDTPEDTDSAHTGSRRSIHLTAHTVKRGLERPETQPDLGRSQGPTAAGSGYRATWIAYEWAVTREESCLERERSREEPHLRVADVTSM